MRVYLDHNATSPPRDEVVDAMTRVLRCVHGNPSSVHEEGRSARAAMDSARESIASLIGVGSGDVLFTAGATEANNTVLLGLARARAGANRHLVTSAAEHPSVEAPLEVLEREGWRVTRVGVDSEGLLDEGQFEEAIPELQQAVKDPRHQVEARFALGRAFLGQGLGDLAQTQLLKALESSDLAAGLQKEILYELGLIHAKVDAKDLALECFKQIYEVDYSYRDVAARVEGSYKGD